jgi:hypothetical protein
MEPLFYANNRSAGALEEGKSERYSVCCTVAVHQIDTSSLYVNGLRKFWKWLQKLGSFLQWTKNTEVCKTGDLSRRFFTPCSQLKPFWFSNYWIKICVHVNPPANGCEPANLSHRQAFETSSSTLHDCNKNGENPLEWSRSTGDRNYERGSTSSQEWTNSPDGE